MIVATTERLVLRWMRPEDAEFILELLNDPGWIEHIGDRGVHDLTGAADYIRNGPMAMYEREGFGLFLVESKDEGESLGICGLIKRDTLDDVDLGFAFLERHCRKGYGYESARSCLELARDSFELHRVVAITSPANEVSAQLLEKLGFSFEATVQLGGEDAETSLYAINLGS